MTVQDVLNAKNFTFRMLAVWIDERAVPRGEFARTRVPDGAVVQVLHMISGG
jgi:sulfur carrier protein